MKTPLLFDLPATAPSFRSKLSDFKQAHGILTYKSVGMLRRDEPWIALIPFADDRGKEVGEIMAESCRLYEESGYCALGEGELTAVRKLCSQKKIVCPL